MEQLRNTRRAVTVPEHPDRPLSARSVMASLLLGRDPPHARTADLVAWCSLFGIAPGTARVALHRMVANGEAVGRDGGYALAGRLEERRGQQEASLRARTRAWRGDWVVVIAPRAGRAPGARAEWRARMRAEHLAELREGVWTRPDNLATERPASPASWWSARPDEDAGRLAARLFGTARWQEEARHHLLELERATRALGGALSTAPMRAGFLAGAAALRHVRADPLLPPTLVPHDWLGPDLRAAYARFQSEFSRAAHTWFKSR